MPARAVRLPTPGSRILGAIKILLFILIPCFVWCVVNMAALDEYLQARARRDQIGAQVEGLKGEIARMKEEESQLERRGFADEAAARERFRLVKPGEKIIFLEWEEDMEGPDRRVER